MAFALANGGAPEKAGVVSFHSLGGLSSTSPRLSTRGLVAATPRSQILKPYTIQAPKHVAAISTTLPPKVALRLPLGTAGSCRAQILQSPPQTPQSKVLLQSPSQTPTSTGAYRAQLLQSLPQKPQSKVMLQSPPQTPMSTGALQRSQSKGMLQSPPQTPMSTAPPAGQTSAASPGKPGQILQSAPQSPESTAAPSSVASSGTVSPTFSLPSCMANSPSATSLSPASFLSQSPEHGSSIGHQTGNLVARVLTLQSPPTAESSISSTTESPPSTESQPVESSLSKTGLVARVLTPQSPPTTENLPIESLGEPGLFARVLTPESPPTTESLPVESSLSKPGLVARVLTPQSPPTTETAPKESSPSLPIVARVLTPQSQPTAESPPKESSPSVARVLTRSPSVARVPTPLLTPQSPPTAESAPKESSPSVARVLTPQSPPTTGTHQQAQLLPNLLTGPSAGATPRRCSSPRLLPAAKISPAPSPKISPALSPQNDPACAVQQAMTQPASPVRLCRVRKPEDAAMNSDQMEARSSKNEDAVALTALGRPSQEVAGLVQVVSLGNSCATKLSIRRLGLDQATMPCDWIRSSMDGLLNWLSHDFKDFLTVEQRYDVRMSDCDMTVFRSHTHSFWHDDISDPACQEKLQRRVDRFLGLAVDSHSKDKPRALLFVRSVATSAEMPQAEALYELLKKHFQKQGRKVYLLIVVDEQPMKGPIVHKKHQEGLLVWLQPRTGKVALDCSALSPYEEAIAYAVRRILNGPEQKEAGCLRVDRAADIFDKDGPLGQMGGKTVRVDGLSKAMDSGLWVGNVQLDGQADETLFAAFEDLDSASAARKAAQYARFGA